jgi:hypothetical protein
MWNRPFAKGVRSYLLWNFVVAGILPTLGLGVCVVIGTLRPSDIYGHGELFAIAAVLAANNFRVHHRLSGNKERYAFALGGTIVLFILALVAWVSILIKLSSYDVSRSGTSSATTVSSTAPSTTIPSVDPEPSASSSNTRPLSSTTLLWGGVASIGFCVLLGSAVAGAESKQESEERAFAKAARS